ncbi:MAG: long-chain fatty acid--CoA ligase [Moorea sp. SIO1G6]|uniref:AMP-binding protein n=1 Tax=Moorena producens (strain JHB) TaxID=1454205 RepID=A0A1D9FVP6_MOOP1|nr:MULTISPECIES: AMP-binding protein [Moorena]AOY79427.1 AMP-binding protein [Moorena producens JHB]NET65484.1 long-chain fatty acid--CoA ligase [Moorena sp. SIO1G6]
MSKNQYAERLRQQERVYLRRVADYSSLQSIPEIWPLAAQRFGSIIALQDPHAVGAHGAPASTLTYTQLHEQIEQFAAGLQSLGFQPTLDEKGIPTRIALFADNSPRWLVADQGIMTAGAVNVVRSGQAEREELLYILEDSGSTALVLENLKTLEKLGDRLDGLPIELVILLSEEQPLSTGSSRQIVNYTQLMEAGASRSVTKANHNRETLATLLYTSGTTGKPKGVMLSHGNLLHQVNTLGTVIEIQKSDRVLSILPTWHAYERSAEYFLLSQGSTQIYTNLRHVKKDLKTFKPNFMVGVPRLWESIYEGVQKQFREQPEGKQKLVQNLLGFSQRYIEARRLAQGLTLDNLNPSPIQKLLATVQASYLWPVHQLANKLVYQKVREATGGEIKQVISGGGSLARHLDNFFEIIGVEVLVGYGLTETSPVTNARRSYRNLRFSAGPPLPETQIRIVDPETHQPLPQGQRGLVMVKGAQVMQEYYHKPEATAKAIDPDGWFDTGDLGWVTPQNDLVLTGRAKDTIVLTNGENIEPQPIEDACLRSAYIDQIMLVGQDQKALGALIVPNLDALQGWAAAQNLTLDVFAQDVDLNTKEVQTLFRSELNREVQNRPGYRQDDRISTFRLILEPFSQENGMMTQTFKIRRPVVTERYRAIIDGMFA